MHFLAGVSAGHVTLVLIADRELDIVLVYSPIQSTSEVFGRLASGPIGLWTLVTTV